jgi:hypothetical protein
VTALVSAVLSFVVVAAAWDVGDQASSRAGAPVLDCHGFLSDFVQIMIAYLKVLLVIIAV